MKNIFKYIICKIHSNGGLINTFSSLPLSLICIEREKKKNLTHSFKLNEDESFYGQDLILLHITMYIAMSLNDVTTYLSKSTDCFGKFCSIPWLWRVFMVHANKYAMVTNKFNQVKKKKKSYNAIERTLILNQNQILTRIQGGIWSKI
jgi:hypothetical protein